MTKIDVAAAHQITFRRYDTHARPFEESAFFSVRHSMYQIMKQRGEDDIGNNTESIELCSLAFQGGKEIDDLSVLFLWPVFGGSTSATYYYFLALRDRQSKGFSLGSHFDSRPAEFAQLYITDSVENGYREFFILDAQNSRESVFTYVPALRGYWEHENE